MQFRESERSTLFSIEMFKTTALTAICFVVLTSFVCSRRLKTTKDKGPPKRWMTIIPPEKPTPSTDSWNEELGFNKIEVVDPKIEKNRGFLEEKYHCKRDEKRVRRGQHYFESDKCLVWHCPKWPIPVGVWEFEYYNCTEIDVRIWPLYHQECRIHRCVTKRIDLKEPLSWPTIPEMYRTVQSVWNGTVFSESREDDR